jgi:hypothetical protein
VHAVKEDAMTTRNTMKWLLVALLAAACHGSSSSRSPVTTPTDVTVPAPSVPSVPIPPSTAPSDTAAPGELAGMAALRLLGVVNPGYTSVFLSVSDVQVWVDGSPVAVNLGDVLMPMDLANGDQAWLLGRFALPPAGEVVKVKIVLDDFGAFEGMGAGDIDARGLPIEYTVPSDWFQPRRHAVIHLDLTRSLVAEGDSKLLLPDFQLFF